jgi:hypothetical protein
MTMSNPDFPVESGVPIPEGRGLWHSPSKRYPWHSMAVGDSFFVPGSANGEAAYLDPGVRAKIFHQMDYQRRKHKKLFAAFPGDNGIRVWRTE